MRTISKRFTFLIKRFSRKINREKTIISLKKRVHLLELAQSRSENYLNSIIKVIPVDLYWKEEQEKILEEKMQATKAAAQASHAKAVAEEEMRKTIMLLVGSIVHDLRTPITAIQTTVHLLEKMLPTLMQNVDAAKSQEATKENVLSAEAWNYLLNNTPITDIQNAIQMMNDFINTTLTELACAHQAASSELSKEQLTKISSLRIIDNTLRAYPFSPGERNKVKQRIHYDFHFMGNSILLMKTLFSLIKNALEQINLKGYGEIIFTTYPDGQYNVISIKDTAGGAAPEVVSHFFDAYFTTKKNGTGIGLAFCKKTMESFGGDIICHSVYGESMEFILKFPILGGNCL